MLRGPLASVPLLLEPTMPVDVEQVGIEPVDDAGAVGMHHVHLPHCLTVVIGHLQDGVAEHRLEGKGAAIADEIQAGEGVCRSRCGCNRSTPAWRLVCEMRSSSA